MPEGRSARGKKEKGKEDSRRKRHCRAPALIKVRLFCLGVCMLSSSVRVCQAFGISLPSMAGGKSLITRSLLARPISMSMTNPNERTRYVIHLHSERIVTYKKHAFYILFLDYD